MNGIPDWKNCGLPCVFVVKKWSLTPFLFLCKKLAKVFVMAMYLLVMFLCCVEAQAAVPTYQAIGGAKSGTGAVTPAWPTHQINDIALLFVESAGGQAVTLSTAAGFVEVSGSPQTTSASGTSGTRITVFWARATSAAMPTPTVADAGDHVNAQILTYRGVISAGNPWDVTGGGVKTTSSTSLSLSSVTTTVANTLIVQAAAKDLDSTSPGFSAQTNAGLTNILERTDIGTKSGNGGGFAVWDGGKAVAGAIGTTTVTVTNSVNAYLTIALKPDRITLGDGTNPANVTLAPSGSITDLDAFTFVTGAGIDSVTGLTVTLTGVNAFQGLSEVRITDSAGTITYFNAISNPVSNTITFSGGTPIPASATLTTFKIRITPKTHPNMPVPPGSTYSIGGTVTAFISSYDQLGSDAASATITVDNLSPASATTVSGSPLAAQVALNWTTSASTDFSRSVMLRWAAVSAGTEVPAEGVDYVNGSAVGTATVVCVRTADAASTVVSGADGGGTGGCSAGALTIDQAYTYKIFQKDSNGNYDVGVLVGTFITPPRVVSINTASANPTTPGASVSWTVTFNQVVTGVIASKFALVQAGGVSGATITSVTGSGTTWTVNANTGSGTGTLGLNMVNVSGISPAITTTMPFAGQVYTVSGPIVSGIVNTYYPGSSSVVAGATSITLGAATGAATPIAIGDTLIIMQMQDAAIDSSNTSAYGTASAVNAGLYEYAIAGSAVALGGGTLTLSCSTKNAYTNAAATASAGQKKFQVIRLPVYANASLSSGLAASPWNGNTGGVLALDVTGELTLASATVNVNGMGFRGGAGRNSTSGSGTNTDYRTPVSNLANGSKGEGIAGTPRYVFTAPATSTDTAVDGYPNGSFARGAPGNAGGGGTDLNPVANDQNPGGGGGANGGSGGIGGVGWCGSFTTTAPYYGCGLSAISSASNPAGSTGGIGGYPVASLGVNQLTLGGGGGAGTTNNATGTLGALSSSGAAGGGIVMLRAGSMSGAATINANGSSGDDSVRNDGSGGGGAGGVVLISAGSGMGGVTINVQGGKGGNNLVPPGSTSTPHGPGGGGGSGYIITMGSPASTSVSAGANGVTYNNGVLFGSYGAMAGGNGSVNTGLIASNIPGVALGSATCAATYHHLEIQHASGTGVTCAPSTLTIKACADAAIPCVTPYTGGVNGTLTATGTPTVNWSGGSGAFTIATGSGTVTKDVQITTVGTVVFSISSPVPLPTNATTCNFGTPVCTFTAADAGFIVTAPDHVAETTSTLTIKAVKKSDNSLACVPGMTGSKTVNLKCVYADPATGTLPVRIAGSALNATANAATQCDAIGRNVSLTFDATGVATPTLQYADVGKMTINASFAGTAGTLDAGLSLTGGGTFIAAPASFAFSSVTGGLIKAGSAFSATVTAQNSAGATTPNFGKEVAAEGVTLTPNLVAPVGGTNPAIGNNVIAGGSFTNGVATVSNLSWGEVGLITITANLTNPGYLGTTLTASGTSGNTGRFIPEHFDTVTSGGMTCPTGLAPCSAQISGTVYSGQAFTTQVTAKNLVGGPTGTTHNYDNGFAYSKLVALSAWDAAGGANANPAGGAMSANAVPASAFSLGVATTSTPVYTLPTSTTAPVDIFVRATESAGGDGVTSLRMASSVEGGMKVISGRYKISNAYGSELLRLGLSASVQYWNGTAWVLSTTDNSTAFNTKLTPAGDLNPLIQSGPLAIGNISVVGAGPVTVAAGVSSFTLNKPGVTGVVDIGLNAPVYLLTGNNGAGVDPSIKGRVTFGVYSGNNNFIYQRESY